jgi:hypothetical protein
LQRLRAVHGLRASADGNSHTDRYAHGHTDQHTNSRADKHAYSHAYANGHVHCDCNWHADCYAYVNIYLPGLSPAASSEPLVLVDIMLVAVH